MMRASFLRRLRHHLAKEYPLYVYQKHGHELGLEKYKALVYRRELEDERANNSYLKLCLRHQRLDLVDSFFTDFKTKGINQELTSVLPILHFVHKQRDDQRQAAYSALVDQLGSVADQIADAQNAWNFVNDYANITAAANSETLNKLPGPQMQQAITTLLDCFEFELAEKLLLRSIYQFDKASLAAKRQNIRLFLEKSGRTNASFSAFMATDPIIIVSPIKVQPPIQASNTWIHWLTQQVIIFSRSAYLESAGRLIRREPNKAISKFFTLLKLERYTNDATIDALIRACIKLDKFEPVDKLVTKLVSLNIKRQLLYYPELLRVALKKGEYERLKQYESFLPLLPLETGLRHQLNKLVLFEQFEKVLELVNEQKDVNAYAELPYVFPALIRTNRLDEAKNIVRQALFGPKIDQKEFWRTVRYAIDYTRTLNTPAQEIEDFFALMVLPKSTQPTSEHEFQQATFGMNNYYLSTKNLAKSAELFSRLDLSKISPRFATALYPWVSKQQSLAEVILYYQRWSAQNPDLPHISYCYARALYEANLPAKALDILSSLAIDYAPAVSLRINVLTALNRDSDAADAIMEQLRQRPHNESHWNRLIRQGNLKQSRQLYEDYQSYLGDSQKIRLLASMATESSEVTLDWEDAIQHLKAQYSLATATCLLNAAFALEQPSYFTEVLESIVTHMPKGDSYNYEFQYSPIITLLYKLGMQGRANDFVSKLDLQKGSLNFQMLALLSQGKIVEALETRSRMILDKVTSLLKPEFIANDSCSELAICPEKDLAGELYNSFFFRSEAIQDNDIQAICDERLVQTFRRSFPHMRFVTKAPQRTRHNSPQRFTQVPLRLLDYFDSASLAAVHSVQLLPAPVGAYFSEPAIRQQRFSGWLKGDPERQAEYADLFSNTGGQVKIGFSPASVLRAPQRNLHFIDVSLWGPIFAIPNITWVNLNAALTASDLASMSKDHNIEILSPELDLFDDLDGVVSLMSQLDFAILPANSLMDLAASVALKTLIFSPSGIMYNWLAPDSDRYLFSEHVEFVHPITVDGIVDREKMVVTMATKLQNSILTGSLKDVG